jgi:hypothetical protein
MTYNDFINKVSALLLYDTDNPDVESDNYINQLVRSWMSEMQFYVDNFKVKNENTYTEADFTVECEGAKIALPMELEKLVKVEFKIPQNRCDEEPNAWVVANSETSAANQTYIDVDGVLTAGNGYTLTNDVDAMAVEGAGTDDANQVYLYLEDFNSKPLYALGGASTSSIFWSENYWNALGTIPLFHYRSTEDVATPDLVSAWTVFAGDAPAPTVRRVQWVIKDDADDIVAYNTTDSVTPPTEGWKQTNTTDSALTATQATWAQAIAAGAEQPEDCFLDCKEVIDMKPIRWDDRNRLLNPSHRTRECYAYAIDKRATEIYVYPYPRDDATDGAESIVITWEGVKQDYQGTDEVPFGFDTIKNCADYVNAELARKKEDKLQRYNSFYESYLRGRLPIYRAQQDKSRQRA